MLNPVSYVLEASRSYFQGPVVEKSYFSVLSSYLSMLMPLYYDDGNNLVINKYLVSSIITLYFSNFLYHKIKFIYLKNNRREKKVDIPENNGNKSENNVVTNDLIDKIQDEMKKNDFPPLNVEELKATCSLVSSFIEALTEKPYTEKIDKIFNEFKNSKVAWETVPSIVKKDDDSAEVYKDNRGNEKIGTSFENGCVNIVKGYNLRKK